MRLCGTCRAGARWPATTRAAARPWLTSAGWRRRREGASARSCSTWLQLRAELQHMAADGEDRVVGIQRSTADRNGKHLDVANCIVFELKDGKVTDGREHFEDLYAWDEFWS